MTRALIDSNVLLGIALDRQPWVADALELASACAAGRFDGYVCAVTLPTVFYVVRRTAGLQKAYTVVRMAIESFQICAVDRPVLEGAIKLPGSDFEDNIQIASALAMGINTVVTRDPSGFVHPVISAMSAAEFLLTLA